MTSWLDGTWKLVAWRRITGDEPVAFPLGADASGELIYTPGGRMTVQITAANRPVLDTDDPLGGDAQARAGAYSTYLAYFGTYEIQDTTVVHRIEGSLYPNWCGQTQIRPLVVQDGDLVLRTPPMRLDDGSTVVNELAWRMEEK
ncbi:MAG TPA: lipocalin-like domain-containing protein [Trebonia sp.]|nr:lipocalin-like domain-containing protein [Trebonia sp.]